MHSFYLIAAVIQLLLNSLEAYKPKKWEEGLYPVVCRAIEDMLNAEEDIHLA